MIFLTRMAFCIRCRMPEGGRDFWSERMNIYKTSIISTSKQTRSDFKLDNEFAN